MFLCLCLNFVGHHSATRALTQMTGRVLRQPYAEVSKMSALNESYIYCFNQDVGEAVQKVKIGLEKEGMGDWATLCARAAAVKGRY